MLKWFSYNLMLTKPESETNHFRTLMTQNFASRASADRFLSDRTRPTSSFLDLFTRWQIAPKKRWHRPCTRASPRAIEAPASNPALGGGQNEIDELQTNRPDCCKPWPDSIFARCFCSTRTMDSPRPSDDPWRYRNSFGNGEAG